MVVRQSLRSLHSVTLVELVPLVLHHRLPSLVLQLEPATHSQLKLQTLLVTVLQVAQVTQLQHLNKSSNLVISTGTMFPFLFHRELNNDKYLV